jgi:hypothetical protein
MSAIDLDHGPIGGGGGASATGVTAAAVIAEDAVVVGAGGARGVEGSLVTIDAAGSITIPPGQALKGGAATLIVYNNGGGWMAINTADGGTEGLSQVRILGNIYLGDISTPTLVQDTGQLVLASRTAPASAAAAGTAGEIRWDASFIYICVATNTWKRIGIATW